MKILLIHNFYRKHLIGGEDVVFRNELAALKSLYGEDNIFEFTVSSDEMSFISLLKNTFFSVSNYLKVKSIIKAEGIDIVHCHNYFPLLSFSPFLAAKKAKAVSILTLHNFRLWCPSGSLYRNGRICHDCLGRSFSAPGILHRCYHNSYFQSFIISISIFTYRFLFKKVDAFVVLTQFQKEILLRYNLVESKKIHVKPNMVRGANIKPGSQKKNSGQFVFVGKLEEQKGIKLIFDLFRSSLPNYKLLIIGDGPLKSTFEKEKTANIEVMGSVPNERIMELIENSMYLIQPSLIYETFGLTIVESMSVGVPVIGFPIGTRKDMIIDGFNGFLMSPEDPQRSIKAAVSIPEAKYIEMSKNCIEYSQKFRAEVIVEQQLKLYQSLMEANRGIVSKITEK